MSLCFAGIEQASCVDAEMIDAIGIEGRRAKDEML